MKNRTILLAAVAVCALLALTAAALALPAELAPLLADPATLFTLATVPAAVQVGAIEGTADEAAAAAAAKAETERQEAAAAAAAAAKANTGKKLKARVLFTCAHGPVNSVVMVDAATAKAGMAAGELDTDKAAVAYAEGLASPAK